MQYYFFGHLFENCNSFRPEAVGVVSGCVFLVTLFLFIPIPFGESLLNGNFPHSEVCNAAI